MPINKSNEVVVSPTSYNKRSVQEMIEWYQKNKKSIQNFANAQESIMHLKDITRNSTKSVPTFSKDNLRTYLQNIGSNERNLRNLSRYLYYRSQVYYRLIMYNATMFYLDGRSVIPKYSLVGENDKESILKSYYDTLLFLDRLNLNYEFLKACITCFREDVFYGCVYYDENSDVTPSMFILPLDPDYCKISGVYQTGDFGFAMDMTYFRNRQDILEFWGEPFTTMYDAYGGNNANRWQQMPDEHAVCLKIRVDDWEVISPVYSGLLNSLINLIDLEDIQAIADEQEIYKLLWIELETISGSSQVDDWKVNPSLLVNYFNKMIEEALPDYVSAAIIPGKINQISFENDKVQDTNKIVKSTESVLNTAGGSQILNSSTISGTTAFNAAIKSDTEMAIASLLPQIESWVNRFISYYVSNPSRVKFFHISTYTKDAFKDSLMKDAQFGLPTKLAINTLNGFSELDTLSLNYLEEDCLGISSKFKPLQSSYTQSSSIEKSNGAPEKTDAEITDEGEASRDKRDKR